MYYFADCYSLVGGSSFDKLWSVIISVLFMATADDTADGAHNEGFLSLQAAPHPNQPPSPLSGCLRFSCGLSADAC